MARDPGTGGRMSATGSPRLALVVAIARGGVIGRENGLPWHVPEDLKHFRRVTTGHAVIMGRKTHLSIGKPLPHRRNIVVSRTPGFAPEGCEVAPDLETAIAMARTSDDAPRVIGGAMLYAEAMPLVTDLFLTELDLEVDGDAFFPPFDRGEFEEVERTMGETPGVRFVRLRRRTSLG